MERQLLGTDIVKKVFGEVKPQIIYQDEDKRITQAKTLDGIVGAYSIIHFDEFGRKFLPEIHKEVLAGKFIGETFREHGVPIHREEECVFVYSLPQELQRTFGRTERESFCKRLQFRIGHVRVPYASIIEIYSPAIGFDCLFEDNEDSIRKTVDELNRTFANNEGYFISSLNPAELERYLGLAHEFLRKPIHVGIEDKQEFIRQTLETGIGLIEDPNTILIVAQREDDFIGYLSANIHPALHVNGRECMIRELFVTEDFRRRGVASSLVRTIEKVALERGTKRVSLATNMGDELQNSFYSSLGYQRRCDFNVKYLGVQNAR